MMTRTTFFTALLSALGAAGTAALLFSYEGGSSFLYGLLAFLIVMAGSFLLALLPEKKRFPLAALLFVCLAAVLILFKSSMESSFTALSVPFLTTLKEPYDVEIAIPKLPYGASPLPAEIFLLLLLSWLFLCGFISKGGAALSALLSLVILLTGFYFGLNPPVFGLVPAGAYVISLPARLKRGFSHPEVPAFLSALVFGLVISFLIPESRYEQPSLFARMQEEIVSFVDPYDPIFHAGNAYTGMMKGPPGTRSWAA